MSEILRVISNMMETADFSKKPACFQFETYSSTPRSIISLGTEMATLFGSQSVNPSRKIQRYGRHKTSHRFNILIVVVSLAVLFFLGAFSIMPLLSGLDPRWDSLILLPILTVLLLYLLRQLFTSQRDLQLLELRFQGLVDMAQEYIWETDSEGHFVYLTRRAEQIFGISLVELLGHRVHEFMSEEESARIRSWLSNILTKPQRFGDVEFCTVHPYVGERWHQFCGEPIVDSHGNIIGYRGVGVDITDRKQAEKSRLEYHELLETLLDTTPSAIYYKDLQGRYLGCNQTFAEWLELSREQILGCCDYDLYPSDLAEMYGEIERWLLSKSGRQQYEAEFAGIGGKPRRNALFNTATFRNAKGDICGSLTVVTDVTNLKKVERELFKAKHQVNTASPAGAAIDGGPIENVCRLAGYAAVPDVFHDLVTLSGKESSAIKLDCRILLVEDGLDNQRLISYILRKAGAEVSVASNGAECLKMVLGEKSISDETTFETDRSYLQCEQDEPYDVILMDMQMPVMDGNQATRRLREANYKGPIIGISAQNIAEAVEYFLASGCDEFVPKPIDRKRLLATIAQHIAQRCAH